MKILFFHPNDYLSVGIPNGIATLAAVLKRAGHQVDVFDTTFIKTKDYTKEATANAGVFLHTEYTLEDLAADDPTQTIELALEKKLAEFQPDLIAVSTMTGHFDWIIEILQKVKPKAKIIIGGVHATIFPEDAFKPKLVDFICVGEAEGMLPELCDCLERGKDYSDIKNLGYRLNGQIKINQPRPFINLDELPTPDWSLFDERHLFRPFMGKIYKGSFYMMSRGCPMRCSYCVNLSLRKKLENCGQYFRYQSPATTVKQLSELKDRYGATWFKFGDDSLTYLSDAYLEELAEGLKKIKINFGCSIRPETATKSKIKLIKAMGCVAATIGVESGSEEIRRQVLNRHMTDEQIERAVTLLKDEGIRISTFNMIGLPGETRADVFKTIRFNKKLKADEVNVYIVYPYPGTEINLKYKINIRGKNGRIIPVSKASSFHLSEMAPEEVDGLLKTFDLYLELPEEMWPKVRQAEANTPAAEKLYQELLGDVNRIKMANSRN